jgi:hypothetical protein
MNLLNSVKRCKNLVAFFCLTIAYCLVNAVDLKGAEENLTVDLNENSECEAKSQTFPILVVGVLSSVVFSFIGILPAFFIRTDADEEKFSKFFLFVLKISYRLRIIKKIILFDLENSVLFKLLLGFAAGSLLADIFFHLLPEASGLYKIRLS